MKAFVILLLLVGVSAPPSYLVNLQAHTPAEQQQDILHLLHKVTEPIRPRFADLKEASKNFDPTADLSHYKDGGAAAVKLQHEVDDNKVLEQKHWFSLFNTRQREESVMLFDVLINCKDWGTFISNAAYFREHMNEGEFVYAFYVAIIHSDLGYHLILPPIYEITPHMFTNTEVINQAYSAKMTQTPGKFRMNFTGSKKNPEKRVAYFAEDIGLSNHHVIWHMCYPFWWKDSYNSHHLDRKGELFIWVHHQLTARYDSERLSNHLNIVDELYWDRPIHEGFAPHSTYKYGGEFPTRPDNVNFADVDGVAQIRDMIISESRIYDAIDHGYIVDREGKKIDIRNEHGIDILGDIIESSLYSPNVEYYGALHNLAHIIVGRQGDPHGKFNQPPSVMEHFETTIRDPIFFRLHKHLDNIYQRHKASLPYYTKAEVEFPGVSINSASIDGKLETYFEDFEFDLQMAVDDTPELEDVPISAVVSRLNHDTFDLNIDVASNNDKDVFATIRVYLCPLEDDNRIAFTFDEGNWHCIELDKFWKTLTPGNNHIVRHSKDASTTDPDTPSYYSLEEKADAAAASGGHFDFPEFTRSWGIPNRLLLPKGNTQGLDFALIVVLTDGSHDAAGEGLKKDVRGGNHARCGGIHGAIYSDTQPFGFPLDRNIPDNFDLFKLPNLNKSIVTIHHRH